MDFEQTLLLLQLSDSAFPTGAFSHSLGLESSVQHRQIKNTEDLAKFITSLLENAGSFSLPFVREAHAAFQEGDMARLQGLDELCHVTTTNHVARKASTRQGKALLDTAVAVFGTAGPERLCGQLLMRHQAVVFGAVLSMLGLGEEMTVTAFMSAVARTAVASAVRLDSIGPLQAQRLLSEFQKQIPDIISRNWTRSADDACVTFPVVDVLQNCHDLLFCKLFYS